MPHNSETEKLGFVQVTTVNGGLWGNLIKPIVNAAYGYTIEVFRGWQHIGSIAVMNQPEANQVSQQLLSMKVQNGDTLIWVSLIPRNVEIDVPLTTKDPNNPLCKLTLMLRVDKNKTRDFATLFHQANDPVEIVKAPITYSLQQYACLHYYSELNDEDMRYRVLRSLLGDNKQYGLVVDGVAHLFVQPDTHTEQRTQITQQANTQALQDRLDQEREARKSDFTREQDAQTQEYRRTQLRRDKNYQRDDALQDSYYQVLKNELPKRLQRAFMTGSPISEIKEVHAKIQAMNAITPAEQPAGELPWQERARLAAPGTFESSHALTGTTISSNPEEDHGAIPGMLQHQRIAFTLPEHGITVLQARLSATQRAKAGVQGFTAMLVCQVDIHGEAFAVGDLITMVEGIAATDIGVLVTILKEKHPATLSAHILRGEEALETTIKSMP